MICKHCNLDTEDFRPHRFVCRSCEREQSRARTFKWTRGISYEERDALLKSQSDKCAACGQDDPGSTKGWHVDHCHKSGTIRGILCATCNIALGQVNDSIERLQKLIDYLRKCNDYLGRE